MQAAHSLNLIFPVYNEGQVIELLLRRLETVFSADACAAHGVGALRFIFIDDGSKDHTATAINQWIVAGFPATLLRFSRNFGHQAALSAGLDHADADWVAVLDADLQDPPELVWEMIARLREGYDVAYALRRDRQDGLLKRLGCWSFYRLAAFLADIDLPLDSGDFCVMTRRVVAAMRSLPEHLRFPRVLRAWVGFRQIGVEYDRPDRAAGSTKYSWVRLYCLATDGIASASIRPLRLAQILAAVCFLLSAAIVLGILLFRVRLLAVEPVMLLFIVLIATVAGLGMLMLCLYILGAYVGRMYLEVKARPIYIIMEAIHGPARIGPEGKPQ